MAYGTLILHGDSRDVVIELIPHTVAARVVRTHAGRVSASQVVFGGDDIHEDDFDGEDGIFSIAFTKMLSVEWFPYPEGDGFGDDDRGLTGRDWKLVADIVDAATRGRPSPPPADAGTTAEAEGGDGDAVDDVDGGGGDGDDEAVDDT